MLAELAAANAAFAVIKQAVSNGKEIAAAGSAIAQFVGAKEKLERKTQQKGGGSDLEEFLALEKIKEQEKQLKELMIYTGRPGMWGDWQRFQAKARVARREAEVEAARKRKKIVEGTIIALFVLCCLAVLGALIALILHHQGRI
jgi:molecular chaperone GrpE (heat shock protein)